MAAALAASALLSAACWQISGIHVMDLPERDGDADTEDFDTAPDDQEGTDDGGPTDSVETADPAVEDVPPVDAADEDSIPTIDLRALCEAYQMVRCAYMDSCCTAEDYAIAGDFLADYSCDGPDASADYQNCMNAYGPSVDDGRILLALSGFTRCQQALLNLTGGECPGWGRFARYLAMAIELDCVDLFVGTVARGETCRFRAECAGSSCCVGGVCTSCISPDGACESNESCPVGQRCIGRDCVPPAGANEACDLADEAGVSDCAPDFYCGGEACVALADSNGNCVISGTLFPSCAGICFDDGTCKDLCGY